MNIRLVSRSIGILLLLLAAAMTACFCVGSILPAGEGHSSASAHKGWGLAIAITLAGGGALYFFGRGTGRDRILRKDAIGIVGLSWFVCGLFAALPYFLCEPSLPASEAFFEGVSGLTTTGATVITDLAALPKTVLLWRSLTQWLGGMGILAMFVLVLSSLGASGLSMFRAETSAHGQDLSGATLRNMARWLWMLYITLTLICCLGMWALGMTPFQAINHAMTTVATGGFSTEDASFSAEGFGIALKLWTILFMFLCGISLPLYIALIRKRSLHLLRQHEETWVYIGLIVSFSVIAIAKRIYSNNFTAPWVEESVDTIFNVVSIMTSTGFATGDYNLWPPAAKGILLFAMVIGGCAGSTAGGLKVSRIILCVRMLRIEVARMYRPNKVAILKLNGHPIPAGAQGQTFVVLCAGAGLMAFSGYLMLAFEPNHSADGCLSAVISCLTNIGPAFKEFGPTQNYAGLTHGSKIMLPLLMIVGRLEYLAVIALFSKNLWRRF
ncbi:MAG: trk system potassium uptake protein TrkH [Verrucomicrobiales bacterium]